MCCVLVILLCCCCWPRLPLPLRCLPAAPSLPLSSTTQTHSSTVSSTVQSPTDTHCTISLLSPPFILVHVLFSFFFLSPPSLPVSSIIFSPTHTHFRSFPVHLNSSLFSPLSSFLSLSLSHRITYVQSTPGVPSALPLVSTTTGSSSPQQAQPTPGSAYVPSHLATLGFTAIAPPGQNLVQPLITGQ